MLQPYSWSDAVCLALQKKLPCAKFIVIGGRFLGTATSTLASIDSEGRVVITSLQSAAADDQIKVDQLLNLSIDGMSGLSFHCKFQFSIQCGSILGLLLSNVQLQTYFTQDPR